MFKKFINNLLFFSAFVFGILGAVFGIVMTLAYVTSTFGPFAGMFTAGMIVIVVASLISTYAD